tara:strand:+ start:1205 stop:1387 length:183 start_codon:yes stop_codon:yes gene_type:complete
LVDYITNDTPKKLANHDAITPDANFKNVATTYGHDGKNDKPVDGTHYRESKKGMYTKKLS